MDSEIGLLVVDDNRTMRDALRAVFLYAGIERLGEASTCEEALAEVERGRFDVVLLDLALADGNGLELLPRIKAIDPTLSVIFHSYHDESHYAARAQQLGASGYLIKGTDRAQLVEAVRLAARGERLWMDEPQGGPQILQPAVRSWSNPP